MGDSGRNKLINELVQGRVSARQLQICLNVPSTSQETRELLIQRIITAFEKSLAMVNWNGGSVGEASKQPPESPPFSPRSEDSDRDFRDQDQNASRKRKTLPSRTKQIRVSPGMAVEAPLDDGYSWRKYGQKDILGAKYPRGYYRCTHRNVLGCLATKQVQRSDEDPNILEITYRGTHTCTLAPTSDQRENQESQPNAYPQQEPEQLGNLRAGLRVLTENLDASQQSSFASFHFPENQVLLSPMIENSFPENFTSPPYISPATSGASPSGLNSFGGHQNLATSGSDISEIISAANSPTVGLEFPFDQFEFDGQHFTFDNSRFF